MFISSFVTDVWFATTDVYMTASWKKNIHVSYSNISTGILKIIGKYFEIM